MENAVDALKMAFAIFVFIMALSLAIYMFTMARETSDVVLQSSDVTALMEYTEVSDMIGEDRIVGLETIIPTLYKYYKENYTVIFLDTDGTPLELYETQTNVDLWSTGYTNRYYNNNKDVKVCSFDVDEETRRHEPWTGNTNYYKQNLDMFLWEAHLYRQVEMVWIIIMKTLLVQVDLSKNIKINNLEKALESTHITT